MEILTIWLVSAALLYLMATIVPGVTISSFPRAMMAAVFVGFFNGILRPFLVFISFPINFLTLGLFAFVINAVILRISAGVMKGFTINGWGPAILGAVVMTLLQMVMSFFFGSIGQ